MHNTILKIKLIGHTPVQGCHDDGSKATVETSDLTNPKNSGCDPKTVDAAQKHNLAYAYKDNQNLQLILVYLQVTLLDLRCFLKVNAVWFFGLGVRNVEFTLVECFPKVT